MIDETRDNEDYTLSLLDEELPSKYVDQEIYADDEQIEWNAEALFLFDQKQLLKCLKSKEVSRYTVEYFLDVLSDSDISFWENVLYTMIQAYGLNYLMLYLQSDTKGSDFVDNVIELVRDLKVRLVDLKELGIIDEDVSRDILEKISDDNFKSKYTKEAIKFMTIKSFNRFKKMVF